MIRKDLIKSIVDHTDLTKEQADRTLDILINSIETAICNDDNVLLANFGKFSKKPRAKRIGRNPVTGERISIPPHNTIVFKPGRHFYDLLNK